MADPESEAEIQQALSALVKDRTVLVIAHRPAAVRGADRIAVMDGGRIVAAGTHDDLADDPRYRALLRQAGGLETATGKEDPSLADGATDSPDDGVADSAADVRVLRRRPPALMTGMGGRGPRVRCPPSPASPPGRWTPCCPASAGS